MAMVLGLSVPGCRVSEKCYQTQYESDIASAEGPEKLILRVSQIHRWDIEKNEIVPMYYTWEVRNLPEYDRCGWTGRYFCKPMPGDKCYIIYSQKAGCSLCVGVEKANDRNGE